MIGTTRDAAQTRCHQNMTHAYHQVLLQGILLSQVWHTCSWSFLTDRHVNATAQALMVHCNTALYFNFVGTTPVGMMFVIGSPDTVFLWFCTINLCVNAQIKLIILLFDWTFIINSSSTIHVCIVPN